MNTLRLVLKELTDMYVNHGFIVGTLYLIVFVSYHTFMSLVVLFFILPFIALSHILISLVGPIPKSTLKTKPNNKEHFSLFTTYTQEQIDEDRKKKRKAYKKRIKQLKALENANK